MTTIYIFIHLVVCLTTGPKPLPKRALHIVRSRAFFFKWEYPLLSLRSSSSFLRLLPCLSVTSIRPFIFPSVHIYIYEELGLNPPPLQLIYYMPNFDRREKWVFWFSPLWFYFHYPCHHRRHESFVLSRAEVKVVCLLQAGNLSY
jgi:hypothetical protein